MQSTGLHKDLAFVLTGCSIKTKVMKNLHNFHVLFWLKKTLVKRYETIPIYARIKVDGIPADIGTKKSTLEAIIYASLFLIFIRDFHET